MKRFVFLFFIMYLLGMSFILHAQINPYNHLYDSLIIASHDSLVLDLQSLIGKPFPYFEVQSIKGEKYDGKMLLGKCSFIFFWFTSCSPCRAAFENYNTLFEKSKQQNGLLLLSFTNDNFKTANQTALEENFKFPIVSIADSNKIYPAFNYGFPLYFIVDNLGIVRFAKSGGYQEKKKSNYFFNVQILQKLEDILKVIDKK